LIYGGGGDGAVCAIGGGGGATTGGGGGGAQPATKAGVLTTPAMTAALRNSARRDSLSSTSLMYPSKTVRASGATCTHRPGKWQSTGTNKCAAAGRTSRR